MDYSLQLFELLGALARRRYHTAEHYFAALGLNHTEARLLTLLEQAQGTATQEALSRQLSVDRSNAGRGLQRLEQGGYIARSEHEGDKRTKFVELTAQGRQAVGAIARLRQQIADGFFAALQEDEAKILLELLQKALRQASPGTRANVSGRNNDERPSQGE